MSRNTKSLTSIGFLIVGLFAFRSRVECDEVMIGRLKERVTQFFTALQASQLDKAEQYVVEKARSDFKSQQHGRMLAFGIVGVKMEDSAQSAIVEMSYKVLIPTIVRQVNIPDMIRWKLISGEWFYDPEDPPPSLANKFQEYYYQKVPPSPPGKGKSTKGPKASKFLVQFEQDSIDIGTVEKGKTVNLRFAFTNQSSQEVKIEEFYFRAPFLKSTTGKRVFKAGEKGEINVELDTSDLLRSFEHGFFVEFQPVKELIPLKIKGKVIKPKELKQSTLKQDPGQAVRSAVP